MRAHIIKDGNIINTIIVDTLDFVPNLVTGENKFGIGDTFNGKDFTKVEPIIKPPTPEEEEKAKLEIINQDVMAYLTTWVAKQPDAPESVKAAIEAGKK